MDPDDLRPEPAFLVERLLPGLGFLLTAFGTGAGISAALPRGSFSEFLASAVALVGFALVLVGALFTNCRYDHR